MHHPIAIAIAVSFAIFGCDNKEKTTSTTSASASAANTTASAAPKATTAPPASAAKATAAAPKKLPDAKKHAVPVDWEHLADAKKGFGFSLPKGSKQHGETKNGVDVYVAELPKPHTIEVMVVVYKDASKTLADLQKDAVKVAESLDNKDVKVEKTDELTSDYHLATMTMTDAKKVKWKVKALLATDVTDNYLCMVGSPDSEWKANEETVDEVWGSFEMWSGGSSGESK